MTQDYINMMSEFNQKAMSSAQKLADINTRYFEKLMEQQAGVAKMFMEGGTRQMELVRDSKGIADYWATQADLNQEYASKMMNTTRDTFSIMSDAKTEYSSMFEEGVKTASEYAKNGAETATKATTGNKKSGS